MNNYEMIHNNQTVTLCFTGQVCGGKNNMGITRTGIHYPHPKFKAWRDVQTYIIRQQWEGAKPLDCDLSIAITYRAADRRIRDIPAILDALFHVLERAEVVGNDSLIKNITFTQHVDKRMAGVDMRISRK